MKDAPVKLRTLGGLRLVGSGFTQPKPLLLLVYLALEGPQPRAFLAELFWPQGESRKSLSMALTRLHGVRPEGLPELVQADARRVRAMLESDVQELLGALERRDFAAAVGLYGGGFLEGAALGDLGVELSEWVYRTREYLAERVQYGLLELAERAAIARDFGGAGRLAERAYRLPGLGGSDPVALKRLYALLCAASSPLAPGVRREAAEYGMELELTTDAARAGFKPEASAPPLPVRGTSFVGRDEELTELGLRVAQPQVGLVTLLGPAGVGKTRLALQFAREQQRSGTFGDVYFVPLEALPDARLLLPTLLGHLGVSPRGGDPLAQFVDVLAGRRVLMVLDNFEHLAESRGVLSHLLNRCPELKLLVTSRERLRLEEEHVFPLSGLPYAPAETDTDATTTTETAAETAAETTDAVQLFRERAQRVAPRFDLKAALPDVLRVCDLLGGSPLGLELAAGWAGLLSVAEIAEEIGRDLEFLSTNTHNVSERHRSLRAAFETSWRLLSEKEQAVLAKISVFRGGFRREAAGAVAGATIPLLGSLVDKSLLRVLPNGRYDRHPLLYQFTWQKLTELTGNPDARERAQREHAEVFLALAEAAEPHLRGAAQVEWFGRLAEELDNFRAAFGYLADDAEAALRLGAALGHFWSTRGYVDEGRTYLVALLPATRDRGIVRAKALLHAGRLSWLHSDYGDAQTFFEQGLTLAEELREGSLTAELLTGLGRIRYYNHGDPEGARSFYLSALERARASGNKDTTASTLYMLGALEHEQSNYLQAQTYLTEARQLFSELNNLQSLAKALNSLANVRLDLGEPDRARTLQLGALELLRTVGDRHAEGIVLLNLGNDFGRQGDEAKAADYFEMCARLFQKLGDKSMASHALMNLGTSCYHRGDTAKARSFFEQSLALQRTVGDTWRTADALKGLGDALYRQGERENARNCYQQGLAVARKVADKRSMMGTLNALAAWHGGEGDYGAAHEALAEGNELAHRIGDKKALTNLLETRAKLELSAGRLSLAVRLLASAETARRSLNFVRKPWQQSEHEELLSPLRRELGEEAFSRAWSLGQTLDIEAVSL